MPNLLFYETATQLPLEKVRNVVGGYKMVSPCNYHLADIDPNNPNSVFIEELIIDNEDYPSALLRPDGYFAQNQVELGQFPKQTIFFYKHFFEPFEQIKEEFKELPEGEQIAWNCSCRIRKLTKNEIEEICNNVWFPFIGERELCVIPSGIDNPVLWIEKKKTKTVEQIVEVLKDAGILTEITAPLAIAVLKKHRRK